MMMTLIASEGLPDCVSDGVRHQVSAMVIEVSAQKLAHERLASRLELAERRGSSARQQLCALRETLRAAEREVLQRRAAAAAGSTAEAAGSEAEVREALHARLGALMTSNDLRLPPSSGDVTSRARCGASRGARGAAQAA